MGRSAQAALVLALLTWAPALGAQPLTPQDVLQATIARNPRMAELGLTVREAELDAAAQLALRPWTLQTEGGAQGSEQPSVGVIEDGVRRTTTFNASATLLKQFVYGTTLSVAFDLGRTVSKVPFTVADLGISETRTIGPNWSASAGVQARQPLLKGRSREVNELTQTLANQQLELAELERRQAANTLVAEALDAYWNWVAAQLDLSASTQSLARTRVLSEATLAQIEAGQLAELERDIVEQRIAAAEQTLVTAEAAVLDAAETLREVMGESMTPAGPWTAPTQLPTEVVAVPTVDAVLDAARRSSPEVALLDQQVAAARLATIRSRDQVRPELDAIGTISQVGLAGDLGETLVQVGGLNYTVWFLGVSFAVPLDNKLARRTLEADEVAVMAAEARRDDALREIELRVRQARRLLETQQRRLALSGREIELARKNLSAMQAKFEAGLASYLEVLQLEEDLSSAELRYNAARIDVITARVTIDRLSGTLLDVWGLEVK